MDGFAPSESALAEILPRSTPASTGTAAGALTVAGQWRSFTAFPSILAIAMVSSAAARCRGNDVMEAISVT
jgi:hypothetical protein